MKSKRRFQIFILLAMLLSPIGGVLHVRANSSSVQKPDAVINTHDLDVWNAIYVGYVDVNVNERWQFGFTESHSFVLTATPVISGSLTPLLILLDASGKELARGTGQLTSTQPTGNYTLHVQPAAGGGFYILTLREAAQSLPSVSTVASPVSINVGATSTVTVSLNNVPVEGYTSAEFTCTYNASLAQVSNIQVTTLFGADPVAAINGPQNGSFIVAVAGSNGHKATTGGAAFTFSIKGLQAGQTVIDCKARVSKGDNLLTSIASTPGGLAITGSTLTPTPTRTSTASPTPTSNSGLTSTPTPTTTSTPTSGSGLTSTPTRTASPTPTSPPAGTGTLTGKVVASKPVTVSLLNGTTVVASVAANTDGTFSLTAPAGAYTVTAAASGFLSAQGSATLTGGATSTLPTISLLAGDVDNNKVIDQLDALTIGMSYNTAVPAAADLNNDNIINILDLELLARNYRKTGPVAWQ